MVPLNPWPRFWGRVTIGVGGYAVLGLLSGQWLLLALIGVSGTLAWHLWQLYRLEHWLRLERKAAPPLGRGLWGEVFNGLYRKQRRQRERRRNLRRLIREYRDSAKAMPDATVVLRNRDQIQWWNQAARRLLGLSWPEDEGQRIANLYRHPEFTTFVHSGIDSAKTITLPSPVNPDIPLEIRISPYGRDQRLLLARDVTRTRRLEVVRQDFVANVSHELKTPLTVIYGVAEELADEIDQFAPAWRRPLELLVDQAERMRHLVEDLLMLARLEGGQNPAENEPVDVVHLLDRICAEARLLSGERGHQVTLAAEPGLGLLGSEAELRSAFSNLLSNAVRYTPDGGRIDVTWDRDPHGRARFAVRDTGIGIPREHIARLTERFYRVDKARSNATGGTGLGLAIVKHVLARHGGWLNIESQPERGSTFTASFPPGVVRSPDDTPLAEESVRE